MLFTWDGHKELDGVPVAVEGELCLGHGAVGDEAARHHLVLGVGVHPDRAARPVVQHVGDEVAGGRLGQVGGGQRHRDDDAVAGAQPQAVAGDKEGRDADEGEAELAGACRTLVSSLSLSTMLFPLMVVHPN